MKLSILMPGIRTELWYKAYESMARACSGEWELIIVSPKVLPLQLRNVPGIRFLQDWGHPMRCLQLALIEATGDYVAWASDDGLFERDAIDKSFALLQAADFHTQTAVTGKYIEGDTPEPNMLTDAYYYFALHYSAEGLCIPPHYLALNGPWLINRGALLALGGFDCRFESVALGFMDLAMRFQNWGGKVLLQPDCYVRFSHQPGETGDHGPMHRAYFDNDLPLFRELYLRDSGLKRTSVPLNNYQQAAPRWERRFGKTEA